MKHETRITLRLPQPMKDWLTEQKEEEGSSVNFEIIRSIKERMERTELNTHKK